MKKINNYRRIWIRARLRKNNIKCKKEYSRVRGYWRRIKQIKEMDNGK